MVLGLAFLMMVSAILGWVCGTTLSLAVNGIIFFCLVISWVTIGREKDTGLLHYFPVLVPTWLIIVVLAKLLTQ